MRIISITAGISALISLLGAMAADAWLHERIAIVGDTIGLQRSFNVGIAFGLHLGPLQDLFILLALLLLIWVARTSASTHFERTGFGLVIGGGIANLLDRLRDGVVTDMFQVSTFPIFNVADICINVGVAMLLIAVLRGIIKTRQ